MGFDNKEHTTYKGKVVYRRKKHEMTTADKIRIMGDNIQDILREMELPLSLIYEVLFSWWLRSNKKFIWEVIETDIYVNKIFDLSCTLIIKLFTEKPGRKLQEYQVEKIMELLEYTEVNQLKSLQDLIFGFLIAIFEQIFPSWVIDLMRFAYDSAEGSKPPWIPDEILRK
jgi:hypothetical protein